LDHGIFTAIVDGAVASLVVVVVVVWSSHRQTTPSLSSSLSSFSSAAPSGVMAMNRLHPVAVALEATVENRDDDDDEDRSSSTRDRGRREKKSREWMTGKWPATINRSSVSGMPDMNCSMEKDCGAEKTNSTDASVSGQKNDGEGEGEGEGDEGDDENEDDGDGEDDDDGGITACSEWW
jgi:hypothetical protein